MLETDQIQEVSREEDIEQPININSTLVKKEEKKKYGNRFVEDCKYIIIQTIMKLQVIMEFLKSFPR